jgi:hypothetical protein
MQKHSVIIYIQLLWITLYIKTFEKCQTFFEKPGNVLQVNRIIKDSISGWRVLQF